MKSIDTEKVPFQLKSRVFGPNVSVSCQKGDFSAGNVPLQHTHFLYRKQKTLTKHTYLNVAITTELEKYERKAVGDTE
jgi:hypothetical protein